MKTDPKGLGILLQVAFKAATDASPDPDPNKIHDLTERYYKVLIALGEKFDVEFTGPKSGGGGGGGNWKGGSGGGSRQPSARASLPQVSVDYFGDGNPIKFYDQRSLKASGQYKPNAPDFSSVDKFDVRGNGEPNNIPIWLTKDGVLNEDEAKMLVAAGVDINLPNSPQDVQQAAAANVAAATAVF